MEAWRSGLESAPHASQRGKESIMSLSLCQKSRSSARPRNHSSNFSVLVQAKNEGGVNARDK